MRKFLLCASVLVLMTACNPKPAPEYASEQAPAMEMAMAPNTELSAERYDGKAVSPIKRVSDAPVSTFAVDVDTGAYANVRRFLKTGETPPAEAVRTEELLNYFRYDYPLPGDRSKPFSITTDVATTP